MITLGGREGRREGGREGGCGEGREGGGREEEREEGVSVCEWVDV